MNKTEKGTLKQHFIDITNLIQQEFERNVDKYGSKIQCRRGCSQCCSQIFNITQVDAFVIGEHVKTLPLDKQKELKQKAKEYLQEKERKNLNINAEYSVTPKIPCPALGDEGECTIYEARPVVCRRFGMPMYDYKNPGKIYACELNFAEGEEIYDDELIPNQTAIGMKWDQLKEDYAQRKSGGEKFTTVADSILGE